jgi:SAM-dependent methyltransferase
MKPIYFGRDLEAMSFAVNYYRWIFDEFRPCLGQYVAEVGGGTGNFSQTLLDGGVRRLIVFEPSSNTFPNLEERFRNRPEVETLNCRLEEKYKSYPETFDAIVYMNVLEHIENDLQELSLANFVLKPGGNLLIFVPALSMLFSDLDSQLGHFRRYHKKGLIDLVQRAGFELVRVKYLDSFGLVPWFLAFVWLKRTITMGKVSLYDKVVVPILRKLEGVVTPPIGKNLLLIAKKR